MKLNYSSCEENSDSLLSLSLGNPLDQFNRSKLERTPGSN